MTGCTYSDHGLFFFYMPFDEVQLFFRQSHAARENQHQVCIGQAFQIRQIIAGIFPPGNCDLCATVMLFYHLFEFQQGWFRFILPGTGYHVDVKGIILAASGQRHQQKYE